MTDRTMHKRIAELLRLAKGSSFQAEAAAGPATRADSKQGVPRE